ncbi:dihydrofolate synthase / folylpolyglutamate synthase [Proteiniborus ethanoligenes]|uniref:tetrahydrofolate synthase n=1 Tax=Proteiniborus ethanoligenes TaxID=415015 RepID=A0A1H3P9S5_9FIRM|nr:folylpolyglutamate synthase/dihydrofolate synthase family protein [Proteiniborus ethanoligenes]TAH63976.1 MAG: bifunctional folylpolyglutamate synthase/dihydrofolate synthase [Gottschalkiaceae bacterium]SDY97838.1 dihydrofolate synthase / folylpolyglutamate synthase [Proteiniborus ethanoligenes]
MNYREALDYIHGTKKFGSKLGLDNIRALLGLLENPQQDLKFIHVAGTNGKGSTSSFIANTLIEAGYRVGLFTSPYLEVFNERMRINNTDISDDSLAQITLNVKEKVEVMLSRGMNHPTEFEIVTAIAMEYFKKENVDFVVLEVGLGGRYDSTNVIEDSLASVITTISMDHTDILGDTIGKIAYEKAGIIKDNGLVISYPQDKEAQEVIIDVAQKKNSELIIVPTEKIEVIETTAFGSRFNFEYKDIKMLDLEIGLIGVHQIYNASTALTTILSLKERGCISISDEAIRKGLSNTKWSGRLEVLKRNPTFLIDGAHNIQGIHALKKTLKDVFKYNKLILGVAILADKDVDHMIEELVPIADKIIVTEANIFRAMKAEELAEKIKKYNNNVIIESNIEKAVEESFQIATENDLIVFSGSLYLIGDVRTIVKKRC